jgi:hypothetical protein
MQNKIDIFYKLELLSSTPVIFVPNNISSTSKAMQNTQAKIACGTLLNACGLKKK